MACPPEKALDKPMMSNMKLSFPCLAGIKFLDVNENIGVRWFLASIGDIFRFLPSKLGTHRQMGISSISSKGCIQYNWGYRVC